MTIANIPDYDPVAWLITTELQDGTKRTYAATGKYKHVKDACDFGEPIPLFASPKPFSPISADDVTDEMLAVVLEQEQAGCFSDYKSMIAATYNTVIKHKEPK